MRAGPNSGKFGRARNRAFRLSASRDCRMSELSLIKIVKIEPLGGHRLRFRFSDGSVGERDFADIVASGGPMLEPLRDSKYFARVFTEFGAPTWPNGYDLAPTALHAEMSEAGVLRHAEPA